MTAILGISALYHDSAAAILVNGRIRAAAQEERFSRIKHDAGFPAHAVAYCLEEAGLTIDQVDHVAFYEKPLLKFDRLLRTYLAVAPGGFPSFARSIPVWLKDKLHQKKQLRQNLGLKSRKRIVFPQHHESHAASAFYPSPFESSAILTIDGVGEWTTAALGTGEGNRIQLKEELRFPHSLGMLYSAFTYYCGFKVNSGEYKLMGLAPYGQPLYAELIKQKLVQIFDDGSIRLNLEYFNYVAGLTMTSKKFDQLFGRGPRQPETNPTQLDMDLAASIQQVTEQILFKMAEHAARVTGQTKLCLAGGVALNCVANGKLLRSGPFEEIWIQPASGDAGGALGAALFVWHQLLNQPRVPQEHSLQGGSLLGPEFTDQQIQDYLKAQQIPFTAFDDQAAFFDEVTQLLEQGMVVGWFQGRMEYGPRALGNRSILADPRRPDMQSILNQKIKFRESFRPFAPAVLEEHVAEQFDWPYQQGSPYMLLVTTVKDKPAKSPEESSSTGFERLKSIRSSLPAITHVDYTARIQTVNKQHNPRFHQLLQTFHQQTGCPVLVNTSFNIRGEPVVCAPQHALACFLGTNMDVLAIGNQIVLKKNIDPARCVDHQQYLDQYQLD